MQRTQQSLLEKIILALVLVLANLRALMFIFLFPDLSKLSSPAWIEIMLWVLSAAGIFYVMVREEQTANYLALWRRNWLLGAFLALGVFSILWSVDTTATMFRLLELIFATLIASYYGMRLGPERLMEALFWIGAILMILSVALVFGAPPTGTMNWAPFNGAWRGVYWHRNHLGSIVAFLSIVYLCRILFAVKAKDPKWVLDGVFYVFALVIVYFTKSATGYIVLIVLHGVLFLVLIWLLIYSRLTKEHYLILLSIGILVSVLILSNLEFVFGLFNRNTTLTGRVVLWRQLLWLASQRLWLGHGFGAVWMMDAFREHIMHLAGWTSQPLIGDNGFLDIFLHLGSVGLGLFLAVLILVAVRATRYALVQKSLAGFFPFLVVVYAIFANITFSLFAETEVFVWFLIVASLFMSTLPSRLKEP